MTAFLGPQLDQALSSGIAALAGAGQTPQPNPGTDALAAAPKPLLSLAVPQLTQPGGSNLMPLPLGLGSLGDAVGHALRPPDLHSLFPNLTARDFTVKLATAMYGPSVAAALSSKLGPMDDPIRLMAQQAIDQPSGNIPIGGTTPPAQSWENANK
jgi:hypothetical protein